MRLINRPFLRGYRVGLHVVVECHSAVHRDVAAAACSSVLVVTPPAYAPIILRVTSASRNELW